MTPRTAPTRRTAYGGPSSPSGVGEKTDGMFATPMRRASTSPAFWRPLTELVVMLASWAVVVVMSSPWPGRGSPGSGIITRRGSRCRRETREGLPGPGGRRRRHDEDVSLRVVIADDHPVVRGGLRALLSTIEGLEVVGEAADGEAAVREVQLLRPDVLLCDIRMPVLDGVETTRRVRESRAGHGRAGADHVRRRRDGLHGDAGRRPGYLLKGADQDEIVGAIRAVAAGQAIFGPGHRLAGARVLRGARRRRRRRPTSRSRSSPTASATSSPCWPVGGVRRRSRPSSTSRRRR